MTSKKLSFGNEDGNITRIRVIAPAKVFDGSTPAVYHVEAYRQLQDGKEAFVGMAAISWNGTSPLVIYRNNFCVWADGMS